MNRRPSQILWLAAVGMALLMMLSACASGGGGGGGGGGGSGGGGGGGTTPPPISSSQTVDSAGAMVVVNDHSGNLALSLDFPSGALTAPVTITVTQTSTFTADSHVLEGSVFQLGPADLALLKPVTIMIDFAGTTVGAADLRIQRDTG